MFVVYKLVAQTVGLPLRRVLCLLSLKHIYELLMSANLSSSYHFRSSTRAILQKPHVGTNYKIDGISKARSANRKRSVTSPSERIEATYDPRDIRPDVRAENHVCEEPERQDGRINRDSEEDETKKRRVGRNQPLCLSMQTPRDGPWLCSISKGRSLSKLEKASAVAIHYTP